MKDQNSKKRRILLFYEIALFIYMMAAFQLYSVLKKMSFSYDALYVYAVAALVVMLAGLIYCTVLAWKME
ncbi:MAG: hypothetical protein M1169_02820 [Firmicutes bacterium]|jgi:hypothetical protein|nr:hypothetical protein [Bacillota bacterium]